MTLRASHPPRPARLVGSEKGVQIAIDSDWEIHPVQVKELLDRKEDVLLLDVRQQREWDFSRIAGATFLPLGHLQARAETELGLWKKKPIVVYCHAGVRSLNATAFLRQVGFENVRSMAGGIEAWSLMVDSGVPRY